jgi:hypothetical protein
MTTSPHSRWRMEQEAEDAFDGPDEGVCPDCDENWNMCECRAGEECGRWMNGRLSHSCSKAGSEECDFECPYRNSLRFT